MAYSGKNNSFSSIRIYQGSIRDLSGIYQGSIRIYQDLSGHAWDLSGIYQGSISHLSGSIRGCQGPMLNSNNFCFCVSMQVTAAPLTHGARSQLALTSTIPHTCARGICTIRSTEAANPKVASTTTLKHNTEDPRPLSHSECSQNDV